MKAIVAVFLIAFLLPVILGKTFLRDLVLNSLLDSDNLTLQSSDASLGYFSPASVSGVILQTIDESATVQFQEVVADRSWVSMLLSRPNLGDFRFVRPEVEVAILGSEREGSSGATNDGGVVAAPLLPTLSADIVDAHLVLRTLADEPPPIDIKGIDARVQLKRRDNLSIFILEPAVVFDRQPLTPELCGRGLQLIAPLLADEVSATGEFSLSLTKCEIPVRTTSLEPGVKAHAIEINGKLDLHNATVAMNNTLASKTLGMVIKLAGITLPGKLTVAENVTVQFSVMDGRVHHSGLALILPHGERSIEIVSYYEVPRE